MCTAVIRDFLRRGRCEGQTLSHLPRAFASAAEEVPGALSSFGRGGSMSRFSRKWDDTAKRGRRTVSRATFCAAAGHSIPAQTLLLDLVGAHCLTAAGKMRVGKLLHGTRGKTTPRGNVKGRCGRPGEGSVANTMTWSVPFGALEQGAMAAISSPSFLSGVKE